MKKFTILLITALMAFAYNGWGQIISQYIETNSGTFPKGIEIWNSTASSLDFSVNNLVIEKGTNGAPPATDYTLSSGTLAVGDVLVIGTSDMEATAIANGSAFYLKAFTFNGDDALVVKYGGTITDIFGEPGVDPGTGWSGNGVQTWNQNIQLKAGITTGDIVGWSDPSIRFETVSTDPFGDGPIGFGIAPILGGNLPPSISNVTHTPFSVTSTTTVSVSADVTDSDGTVDLVELNWGTTSGILTNTINMSLTGVDTYTTDTDIPVQANGTTVYYQVYAEDNIGDDASSAEMSYTVFDPASTMLPYFESFDADLGDCYPYSVLGDTKYWYWNSGGYAYMSGYNSGVTEEDWLVLPGINFDSYANETMTFDTWYNYGNDDVNNYLKLYYSDDYPGIGDPTGSGYTWTELSFTHPGASQTWTSSGSVDLSSISGTMVYIAFKYNYEAGSYRNWGVDNLSIIEGNPALVADFEADQTTVMPGTTVNFTDLTTGGATPYTSYEWDLDGDGAFDDAFVQNPSFLYSTVGTYDISLRVTDDNSDVDVETKLAYIAVIEIATNIIINEVDADQVGTDAQEFIELYDGGVGLTDLSGLVVVLYNGSDDASYLPAVDLDGYSTNADGYLVMGSALVPNVDIVIGVENIIQNGADAVALHIGNADDFPNDTPVTNVNLIDALVYDTNDGDDSGLIDVLLNPGQPQVNEGGRGSSATHSNQRIPNGSGGQRNTDTYDQSPPTPGAENVLIFADWTGDISTDWYNIGNWANGAIPTSTEEVVIPSGISNYPIIGTGNPEAVCATLYIESGAILTIQPSAGLNVIGTTECDGDFIMQSDASGNSAGFRDGGIDPASTGTFLFDRMVEAYPASNDHLGWHYISTPITGFDSWDMFNYWINYWNEAATGVDPDFPWVHLEGTAPCVPASQLAIGNMEGWSVRQDYDYACNATNPGTGDHILFAGDFADVNSGDFDRDYTFNVLPSAAEYAGYNLMGNPYPSWIDMAAFAGLNVHIWDGSADDYLDWAGTGDFTEIPPSQGFFVYDGGAGNVALTNANRIFGTQPFQKTTTNEVVLLATGNNKEDKTYIRFSEEATAGYDNAGLDAYKLLGTGTAPQIYTVTNGVNFSINTLAETPIVPMSFFAAQSGEYTISAIETSDFANVVLGDRFTGEQTDLLTNSYTFNYTVNDDPDRFFVHFTPLGTPELSANSIDIWSKDHKVYVQVPEINGYIVVFNMMGQEVTRAEIEPGINVIPVTDVNAFYVVKIVGSEVTKTGKVYVK